MKELENATFENNLENQLSEHRFVSINTPYN